MRIPEGLAPLFDYGILEEVLRPLKSGKEAQVYLVRSGGRVCVAKVYKEAQDRTFKNRAEYTEGRKVRNSRDQRAIGKRTKHGRAQDEAAWRSTEVDMIHRLHAGGVRVPTPYHFIDGVLLMELITDAEGNPAPRLGDLAFEPHEAEAIYHRLIREVVRMLCAGVVHGDLSDFNVLVGAEGPVIIDFPQSVDTAHNTNARRLLLRDVDNMHRFLTRFMPHARRLPYAEEMWDLYQQASLTPDTRLGGRFRAPERRVDTSAVLDLIGDANRDERKRRDALGLRGGPPADTRPDTRPEMRSDTRTNPAPQRGPRPDSPPPQRGPRPEGPPPTQQRAPRPEGPPPQHRAPRPEGPPPQHRAPRPEGPPQYRGPRPDGPPPQHRGPRPDGPPPQRGPWPERSPQPPPPQQQHRGGPPPEGAPQHRDPRREGAPRHPSDSSNRRPAGPQQPPQYWSPRPENPVRPRAGSESSSRTEQVGGPRNRRTGPSGGNPVEVIVVNGPPRRPR
jgi:RIO kinase 1